MLIDLFRIINHRRSLWTVIKTRTTYSHFLPKQWTIWSVKISSKTNLKKVFSTSKNNFLQNKNEKRKNVVLINMIIRFVNDDILYSFTLMKLRIEANAYSINWLRALNDPANRRCFRAFSKQTGRTRGRCLPWSQFQGNFSRGKQETFVNRPAGICRASTFVSRRCEGRS